MNFLRKRVLAGELLAGTFCNLGSPLTVEMAGCAGFDWLLLDLEHGSGDQSELLHQLQAAGAAATPAIVRIAWNEPWRFKRVLDPGAGGRDGAVGQHRGGGGRGRGVDALLSRPGCAARRP